MLRRTLGAVRAYHATQPTLAFKILASDPIDRVCAQILCVKPSTLASSAVCPPFPTPRALPLTPLKTKLPSPPARCRKERGCEVVEASKTPYTVEALLAAIPNFDGLIVRSGTTVTREVMEAGKNLKVIGRAGVGVDNIDVPSATKRGIVVMNTPGGNTTSAAELTMSLIMALARNIPQAVASLKAGRWDRSKYMGTELGGKVIGVVGLGRIGREVARWCQSFGMTAIGYDPIMAPEIARAAGITPVSLEELYARSDYITLHAPKTPETANLICAATLEKCKAGVRIVNVARGGIVNEKDLLAALKSGRVAGAALDVFSKEPPPPEAAELLAHPGVICTPHLGASTSEAQVNVARDIAVQMVDALENKAFVGVVNATTNLAFFSRPDLAPLTSLAERMGSLQAQLMKGKLVRITLGLAGPLISDPGVASAMRTAVLRGLLSVTHGGNVTWVNTGALAAELGVNIEERVTPKPGNYTNQLTVGFESDSGEPPRVLSAALFASRDGTANAARLVSFDGYSVDINPTGDMLFFNNEDRPGVLSRITGVLGRAGINIAHFGLGRHKVGGSALGILSCDQPVPAEALRELAALPNVHRLATASLPGVLGEGGEEAAAHAPPTPPALAAGGHSAAATLPRPSARPSSANFGSGPTKKRPGWSLGALSGAVLGRSHRSKAGKDKLGRALDATREILGLPKGHRVAIVPASDTGAYEMAMWSLLGPRGVDSVHFESFGAGWHTDLTKQLKIKDVVEHTAAYGVLPDLSKVSPDKDCLFTWNGTTSGVCVPNADWISPQRTGLTLADCTSAVFSQPVDFEKCDVVTYSWQKVLGGEGAHGMLILGPRAVERLESYTPPWPMPKIFRMTKKGKLEEGLFKGDTINTPSVRPLTTRKRGCLMPATSTRARARPPPLLSPHLLSAPPPCTLSSSLFFGGCCCNRCCAWRTTWTPLPGPPAWAACLASQRAPMRTSRW